MTPPPPAQAIREDVARLRTDRSAASALEIGAIIHVVRPLLADLMATLCFYVAYAATGSVGIATILAAGLGVGQIAWTVANRRPVPAIQWGSLLLVLLVGAMSLATDDPRYVLYKASIIYLAIGCTMLRRGWLFRYLPPIAEAYLPKRAVLVFGYLWAALLLGTGLLSAALIRTEPARTVALVMSIWAPASKLGLLGGQYLVGRVFVRRRIIAALKNAAAADRYAQGEARDRENHGVGIEPAGQALGGRDPTKGPVMPAPRQTLAGSEHAAPRDMRPTGAVPGDDPITVSVYLRADDAMPAAPGNAHSRATVRQRRNKTQAANIAAIAAFAAGAGLEVVETDAARRLVKLRGPASAMERAFGTALHRYERDGVTYRGRQGALSLPGELAESVLAVLGLDTTPVATPKFVPHRGATPPSGFLPTEVAALYGLNGWTAADQCIGIIELGGGYTDADNQAAFAAMGLPVPAIVAIGVDGAANSPGDGSGADGEVALDIQVAGGVAPGARLAVYFAPNTSQGFADAISQAVHDETNRPSVLSISWGGPESGWTGQAIAAMSAAFRDAAMLGVTVTAASGDSLATDGESDGQAHVDYPASDPLVLGCGGTFLMASAGKRQSETVWKSNGGGTGGGVSALFAKPDYQAAADVPSPGGPGGGRGVPDVAGDADPDSGYRIVTGGQTGLIGGTSAVAPLWAGIVAGLNARLDKPVGAPHQTLYRTPAACHDITQGDNRSGAIGYDAARGWDPCTGLGSPDGPQIGKLFGGA